MADVTNPTPSRFSWLAGKDAKRWALVVLALIIGVAAGYYFSNQRSSKEIATIRTQLNRTLIETRYVKDRFYVDDNHNFALIFPKHWVKNFTAARNGTSTTFIFRQAEHLYQPVITVYRCSVDDYAQFKGQTTDESKCPGQLIKQDSSSAYTWKGTDKKHTFVKDLGNTEKVTSDWRETVLPTFQIVD